jgi:hypothetical protein
VQQDPSRFQTARFIAAVIGFLLATDLEFTFSGETNCFASGQVPKN